MAVPAVIAVPAVMAVLAVMAVVLGKDVVVVPLPHRTDGHTPGDVFLAPLVVN